MNLYNYSTCLDCRFRGAISSINVVVGGSLAFSASIFLSLTLFILLIRSPSLLVIFSAFLRHSLNCSVVNLLLTKKSVMSPDLPTSSGSLTMYTSLAMPFTGLGRTNAGGGVAG